MFWAVKNPVENSVESVQNVENLSVCLSARPPQKQSRKKQTVINQPVKDRK